ncbi:UDP-N-acetylmuramoyl-tripeptide--D-alanyl-D-alanine ligase, partial [Halorhodospira neutriphila]
GAAAVLGRRPVAALPTVVVAEPERALAELGRQARRRAGARVAAVTGSNGKTTVKELLAAILAAEGPTLATRGNRNNHLGVPETLCRLDGHHRYAVVEMGANHPGEIATLAAWAAPEVGVVTNAGPAHLEGFGTVRGVAEAKGELFAALGPQGTAVINADDPYADLWRGLAGARRILAFGAGPQAEVRYRGHGEALELRLGGVWRPVPSPLLGACNAANAAAAAACAVALGASEAAVAAGIAAAGAAPGRLEVHPGRRCRRVIDDSYNANPGSLQAALEVLRAQGGEPWLLLGAMAELGPEAAQWHRRAGELARAAGVARLWAVGAEAAPAAAAFGEGGRCFTGHEEMLAACERELPPQAVVLIKGSRSAAMERSVAALTASSTETEER